MWWNGLVGSDFGFKQWKAHFLVLGTVLPCALRDLRGALQAHIPVFHLLSSLRGGDEEIRRPCGRESVGICPIQAEGRFGYECPLALDDLLDVTYKSVKHAISGLWLARAEPPLHVKQVLKHNFHLQSTVFDPESWEKEIPTKLVRLPFAMSWGKFW